MPETTLKVADLVGALKGVRPFTAFGLTDKAFGFGMPSGVLYHWRLLYLKLYALLTLLVMRLFFTYGSKVYAKTMGLIPTRCLRKIFDHVMVCLSIKTAIAGLHRKV